MPEITAEQLDRLDLLAIEGAYASAMDSRDADRWTALFTPDVSYETAAFSRQTGLSPAVGHAALAELCRGFPGDVIHVCGTPDFHIDGDRAWARLTYTTAVGVYKEEGSTPRSAASHSYGYYDVEYQRTPDGWKIHRRVSNHVTRIESYAGGVIPPALWRA